MPNINLGEDETLVALGTRTSLSFLIKWKDKCLHAGTGTGSEVELITAAGPGRHAGARLAQSGNVGPGQALDGRVPCRVRSFNGHYAVALDEA